MPEGPFERFFKKLNRIKKTDKKQAGKVPAESSFSSEPKEASFREYVLGLIDRIGPSHREFFDSFPAKIQSDIIEDIENKKKEGMSEHHILDRLSKLIWESDELIRMDKTASEKNTGRSPSTE